MCINQKKIVDPNQEVEILEGILCNWNIDILSIGDMIQLIIELDNESNIFLQVFYIPFDVFMVWL